MPERTHRRAIAAWPPATLSPLAPDRVDPAARLSELLGKGLTNVEIAAELHMSTSTVKRRISDLLVEHSLTNRRQLAELARSRERSLR